MVAYKIDAQTIEYINAGKEKAFATLYDCYYSYLCAFATTYIFDADDAQEIVNEVFLNVWNSRGQLSFPIHGYLMRSVQNRCLNYIRSRQIRERALDGYRKELLEYQEEFCKYDGNPLQLLEVEEVRSQVRQAIDSLPDRCRLVFEKYIYEALSPQEIADQLHLSVNTVRVHIKNAMDVLRNHLGPIILLLLQLLRAE